MTRLLASVSLLILSQAALGADLFLPPSAVPGPSSGFYVGGAFGGAWDNGNGLFTPGNNPGGFIDFKPSPHGLTAGAYLGYGQQFGNWYLGAEADGNWAGLDGAVDVPIPEYSADQKTKWLASIRARLGIVTIGNSLFYITAGYGWGNETLTLGAAGFSSEIISTSKTSSGWVAGGGIEIPVVSKVSLRLEYLRYQLGDLTMAGIPSQAGAPLDTIMVHNQIDLVRAGVTYRF